MKKLFLLVLPLLVLGACDKGASQCKSGAACKACISECVAQAGSDQRAVCDCMCHQAIDKGESLLDAIEACIKID